MPPTSWAPGRRRLRRREELSKWAFLAPAIVFLALFFGYPIVKNVTMILHEYKTRTF